MEAVIALVFYWYHKYTSCYKYLVLVHNCYKKVSYDEFCTHGIYFLFEKPLLFQLVHTLLSQLLPVGTTYDSPSRQQSCSKCLFLNRQYILKK